MGRCHLHAEPRTFRLDRVAEVREIGTRFTRPADFDLDRYLEHTWSIFRGRRLQEVVVHFQASLAPLLEHARHHASERLARLPDGTIEYRLRVSHLDELARWLVGFGGQAQVLEPAELARQMRELLGQR